MSDKKYGSYTNEEINDWQSLPANSRVLTSSGFGAWLLRRDERKGNRDLIIELEKIKTEIECNMRKNNCDLYGYADSLVIIDNHISELKGENYV